MNRDTIVTNGTVFGIWPLGRSMVVVGLLLIVIFVLIEPEASYGLGLVERTIFWTINIGLGLVSLYAASWLVLPRVMHRLPAWLALLIAGLAGAILLAPVAFLVEQVLPEALQAVEEDDWLDRFSSRGRWQGVLVEFLESAPTILAVWMAINLPFLTANAELNDTTDPDGGKGNSGPRDVEKEEAGRYAEEVRKDFLQTLPESLGTNVLAISSDLHYLHVHTELGRSMILGSLQRAAEAMGDEGMRIHRAHWVARKAIVKIVKDGTQWYCLLSNGLRVPISRRKKSTVAGWFGHNTKIVPVDKSRHGAA